MSGLLFARFRIVDYNTVAFFYKREGKKKWAGNVKLNYMYISK